jgi:hypothetical protein
MNTETAAESISEEIEIPLSERGDPARTHSAEHIFGFKHHLVSAAREPQDLLSFEYWSRHAGMLRAGDILWCEPADRAWWAVIRVLEVCGEGIVVEPIASKETLRYQAPAPKRGALGTNADEFEIRRSEEFTGKFAVVRIHDGHVMTKGTPLTRPQCEDWLRQYLVTVRKT